MSNFQGVWPRYERATAYIPSDRIRCVAAVNDVVGTSLWSVFTEKAELVGAVVMRTASEETTVALLRETAGALVSPAEADKRLSQPARRASPRKGGWAALCAAGPSATTATGP